MSFKDEIDYQDIISLLERYIRKRIKNPQDAEDILQTILLKVFTKSKDVHNEHNIYPWVYKIAKNTIVDYYRTQNLTEVLNMDRLENQFVETYQDQTPITNPVSKCIAPMVDKLPIIYKEAIKLYEFEEHTQKEISERFGLSISGAKSRVQRGREKLKSMILDCCDLQYDKYGNIIEYECKNNIYCEL